MSVKRGYKQTEVGVIPEEWEVLHLGAVVRLQGGYSFRSELFADVGVPVVRISDIQEGTASIRNAICHPLTNLANDFLLRTGDILIAMSGATTGKVGVYRETAPAYMNQRVGRLIVRDPSAASLQFIEMVVRSSMFGVALSKLLEQGAQPNISGRQIESLIFAMPSEVGERRAISAALSDVDALVASVDKLIAKKRDLKQAAMQQLLTGQTRLPGFGGKWSAINLGAAGSWCSGGTPSKRVQQYWSGSTPWVSPKDMKVARLHDAIDHVSDKAIGNGTRLLPRGAILVVVRGMILAHSAPVARAERALAFNQDIKGLVVREGIDSNFLLWWLVASEATLLSLTNEATHGTKRIPTEALYALIIRIPELNEQSAIASVLSDMDAEIAALEKRRDKTKFVKQGMMQELLTGRTRLV